MIAQSIPTPPAPDAPQPSMGALLAKMYIAKRAALQSIREAGLQVQQAQDAFVSAPQQLYIKNGPEGLEAIQRHLAQSAQVDGFNRQITRAEEILTSVDTAYAPLLVAGQRIAARAAGQAPG